MCILELEINRPLPSAKSSLFVLLFHSQHLVPNNKEVLCSHVNRWYANESVMLKHYGIVLLALCEHACLETTYICLPPY